MGEEENQFVSSVERRDRVLGQAQQLLRKTTLVQAVVLWLNISTKPKNRTFLFMLQKSPKTATKMAQNRRKGKQAIKWLLGDMKPIQKE